MQNPATQVPILTKPKRRKLQTMEIGSDVWFLTAAPVEEKNTLEWRVGLICFGFDLFMGFWGLEVESGTTFGESKKRKGRTRKSLNCWSKTKLSPMDLISRWLNLSLFDLSSIEFYVYVDKFPRQLQHDVKIEFIVLDLAIQNRVCYTKVVKYQNSFKPWLTNVFFFQ